MLKALADEPAGLRLEMLDESPSVYLDHWALRAIASRGELAGRLASALERASGTLCISAWNILEFSKVSCVATIREAEALLEACFPRLFFVECDPRVVIERENAFLAGAGSMSPHADLDILKIIPLLEPRGSEVLGVRGLLDAVRGSGLDQGLTKLGETFKLLIIDLRKEVATDSALQSNARRAPAGPGYQRATRFILRELVRTLALHQTMNLSSNDALDFLHGVVPIAYSDYVLLDRRWASLGRQAVQRLRSAGHETRVAEIFSGEQGQVEMFLLSLERGSESPNPYEAPGCQARRGS